MIYSQYNGQYSSNVSGYIYSTLNKIKSVQRNY
jgi:hypothetical protein